jgi:hypothetical protein
LEISNVNEFSTYIRNMGALLVENNDPNQFLTRSLAQPINANLNQAFQPPPANQIRQQQQEMYQQRNTNYNPNSTNRNERPIMGGGGGGGVGSLGANVSTGNNSYANRRNRPVQSPVGFNVNFNNPSGGTMNNNGRQSFRNSNNAVNPSTVSTNLARSNTFVIETEPDEPDPNARTTRSVDLNQIYNVRRVPRAKTPMAFNVMLDEPVNNIQFDENGYGTSRPQDLTSASVYLTTPNQPKINYGSKKKAKLMIGKQGKEYGEFIWPLDVSVNNFNNQILIADSNNHRIQIFESDGRFVKSFGRQGKREGQFDFVSGLFVDSMSNIFVVDRLNHRVQIFDRYSRYVRSIGSGPGNSPGQLNHPWGIAVNRISESINS